MLYSRLVCLSSPPTAELCRKLRPHRAANLGKYRSIKKIRGLCSPPGVYSSCTSTTFTATPRHLLSRGRKICFARPSVLNNRSPASASVSACLSAPPRPLAPFAPLSLASTKITKNDGELGRRHRPVQRDRRPRKTKGRRWNVSAMERGPRRCGQAPSAGSRLVGATAPVR